MTTFSSRYPSSRDVRTMSYYELAQTAIIQLQASVPAFISRPAREDAN